MSNELKTIDKDVIASLVINGDLKRLTTAQKVDYYSYRCQQAGLDPAAKPFDLLTLNGKEVLYANASCTQQLCSIHRLSHEVTSRELVDDIYCVFVRVKGPDGRSTENMGAVPVAGLKGEPKANAMLKATTKGIRRAVLAHCGLGMLDETEVETIPGATRAALPPIEPEPFQPQEWTDEDVKTATISVMGFGDQLASDFHLDEADIYPILAKPKSTIGDPTISPEVWFRRFLGYCDSVTKKHGGAK